MFETALDSTESNLPCDYVLTIRCSHRSIANAEEIEAKEAVPTQSIGAYSGIGAGDAGPM
jgi:hypothetical protein